MSIALGKKIPLIRALLTQVVELSEQIPTGFVYREEKDEASIYIGSDQRMQSIELWSDDNVPLGKFITRSRNVSPLMAKGMLGMMDHLIKTGKNYGAPRALQSLCDLFPDDGTKLIL